MNALYVSILIFTAAFTSCDCLQHLQGVVIDSETRLPIDRVIIKENRRDRVIHTDSLGNFELTSITGGLFSCPKISLSFEKEGYSKEIKKYESCCTDNVVVVLEKQTK